MPDDLTQVRVFANYPAQAMSARQGQDPQGLGATPASAVPQGCAPNPPSGDLQ
jgi:hypothetical protein